MSSRQLRFPRLAGPGPGTAEPFPLRARALTDGARGHPQILAAQAVGRIGVAGHGIPPVGREVGREVGSVEGWSGSVEGWSGSVKIGTGDRPERAGGRVTATSCRDWRRGVATCPTTDHNTDDTRGIRGAVLGRKDWDGMKKDKSDS